MRILLVVATVVIAVAGCSSDVDRQTIVASNYPLSFAAERVAPRAEVIGLTPPGVESHDLELTLEQRAEIQGADMVVYLGDIGFQPQVEQAVAEAQGTVVDLSADLHRADGVVDPHAWLEPSAFTRLVGAITQEFCPSEDACSAPDRAPIEAFEVELSQLHDAYTQGLASCRHQVMIVSHEAFGYLELYDLEQLGLAGLTPEAEPSADRLSEARQLVARGEAAALFYEARGEDADVAKVLAGDLGVPAFPLDTLESQPPEGDYFSVMETNLQSLREGLQCR